ncbi:MAG TPA: TadE family protein [Candidatus Dormibacteraeota bacterium]|nr:TadE family protein [Candidatus Dormibacteraeota bacterium]
MSAPRAAMADATAGRRGQSLVEFALVIPIFVLVLFGAVDAGRLVYLNSVLSQAAREGARLGAVEASWIGSADASCGASGGPICPQGVTSGTPNLQADVLAAANRMVTPFASIASANVYISCDTVGTAPTGSWTGVSCASHTTNNVISVRVRLQFAPITPVIAQIIGSPWLSGAATMVIN